MIFVSKITNGQSISVLLPRALYKIRHGLRADTTTANSFMALNVESKGVDVSAKFWVPGNWPTNDAPVLPLSGSVDLYASFSTVMDAGWVSFEKVGDF